MLDARKLPLGAPEPLVLTPDKAPTRNTWVAELNTNPPRPVRSMEAVRTDEPSAPLTPKLKGEAPLIVSVPPPVIVVDESALAVGSAKDATVWSFAPRLSELVPENASPLVDASRLFPPDRTSEEPVTVVVPV